MFIDALVGRVAPRPMPAKPAPSVTNNDASTGLDMVCAPQQTSSLVSPTDTEFPSEIRQEKEASPTGLEFSVAGQL